MITKKEYNKRIFLKYLLYSFGVVFGIFLLLWVFNFTNLNLFFDSLEQKSFDARQRTIASKKVVNENLVILTIDSASYEYLVGKYGEWPIPRKVYADIAKYIEAQKPAAIAFDLMFVKSLKGSLQDDSYLAEQFAKYDNLYTSINFDPSDEQIRKAEALPDVLKIKLNNASNLDLNNAFIKFSNCRVILQEIMNATSKIGHINLIRDNDGIARRMSPFVEYKNDFYPHLALKVGMDYLNKDKSIDIKKLTIDKNRNLIVGNRKIPLDASGSAILNWYGASGKTFRYIPIWMLDKLAYGEDVENDLGLEKSFFKDKIVYVGTSAVSLYDIKSTPVEVNMPGVELHTTFLNNLIDNNFIKRTSVTLDIIITLVLSLLTGYIVLKFASTVFASIWSILLIIFYSCFATWIMQVFNVWVGIIFPVSFVIFTFIGVYLVKYIQKSRDFEHTYKLATTDGLTELYNHRYFQEQMIMNIETAKRYEANFSLILIDIDFFKKFNDKFGHQSGDAVLKQVAQTLKKNVRSADIVCRYGGEEMAVILPSTNKAEAVLTAQKLCNAVADRVFDLADNQKEHVTISLGVATFPQDGDAAQLIIEKSDKNLYKAKENGRNQVGFD